MSPMRLLRGRMRAAKIRMISKPKWRGGLERSIIKDFEDKGVEYQYEVLNIPYRLRKNYIPDFLLPNGIVVEAKGFWKSEDRQKIRRVIEQHPFIDLRMVFSNSANRIAKKSPTTYATYCDKLGIPYADGLVPQRWIDEPFNLSRWIAVKELMK